MYLFIRFSKTGNKTTTLSDGVYIVECLDLIGSAGSLVVGFFELLNGEIDILEAHSRRILNARVSIRIPDTKGFGRVVGSLSMAGSSIALATTMVGNERGGLAVFELRSQFWLRNEIVPNSSVVVLAGKDRRSQVLGGQLNEFEKHSTVVDSVRKKFNRH
jgi:hypothetical protein